MIGFASNSCSFKLSVKASNATTYILCCLSRLALQLPGVGTFNGVSISRTIPFNPRELNFRLAIDRVSDWLINDGLDLVCFYTAEPDLTGHAWVIVRVIWCWLSCWPCNIRYTDSIYEEAGKLSGLVVQSRRGNAFSLVSTLSWFTRWEIDLEMQPVPYLLGQDI